MKKQKNKQTEIEEKELSKQFFEQKKKKRAVTCKSNNLF